MESGLAKGYAILGIRQSAWPAGFTYIGKVFSKVTVAFHDSSTETEGEINVVSTTGVPVVLIGAVEPAVR